MFGSPLPFARWIASIKQGTSPAAQWKSAPSAVPHGQPSGETDAQHCNATRTSLLDHGTSFVLMQNGRSLLDCLASIYRTIPGLIPGMSR